jgi:sortase A
VVLQEKARAGAAPGPGVVILRGTVQVLGELLITAGIILLLFVGWQLWWTNVESDAKQSAIIKEFAQDLGAEAPSPEPTGTPAPPGNPVDYGAPVVSAEH